MNACDSNNRIDNGSARVNHNRLIEAIGLKMQRKKSRTFHWKRLGWTTAVGGPEPGVYAEEYLATGADIVVTGEGELTLERLMTRRSLRNRTPRRQGNTVGISVLTGPTIRLYLRPQFCS